MQVLLVVFAPVLMIAFAMAMEGIEARLTRNATHVTDPQEFIDTHTPGEGRAAEAALPVEHAQAR